MYNFFKPSHQVLLNKHFSERQQKFWHKKKPFSENYSFQIHDPFEIFGEDTKGFEKLYLVGDNWIENPDKPIAIIIGCNDWKFGFIADYLVDFRCAFGTRKLVGFNMTKVIFNLDIKPEVAVVWGYTETSFLRFYLNKKKIPIWRVEDGFIRSATLGAVHSTPYSLVIDKTGLYYNGSQTSDIENILNTYDFDEDNLSKDQAVKLLKLIKSQKISKYNPPIIHHTNSLKIKKRILVIGQVDNDASLRYGNPNNWSMEDMVRLAKYENPNAEVLYRPHPEVYKGYQKTKFKKNNIKDFAKILTPDEHVIELIERVDHVYTLTSLTGLEALLRGKKVTVLGTPFYAGWGLTDDRSMFERRHRKLSLIELFIGTYLLYPKYLSELIGNQTKEEAILTTIYKIKGDILENFYNYNTQANDIESLSLNLKYKLLKYFKDINSLSSIQICEIFIFFKKYNIDDFLLNLIFGLLDNKSKKMNFLLDVSNIVESEVYFSFIEEIKNEFESEDINYLVAKILSSKNIEIKKNEFELFFSEAFNTIKSNSSIPTEIEVENLVKKEPIDIQKSIAQLKSKELLVQIEYEDSINSLISIKNLLKSPEQDYINLLNQASSILYEKFEFNKSKGLALVSIMLNINKNNRKALTKYIESQYIISKYKINEEILGLIFLSIKTNPELISKYRSMIGREDNSFTLLNTSICLDKEQSISKMMGYIESGYYEKAHKLFYQLYEKPNVKHDKLIKVYTDFLHAEGKTLEAIDILNQYKLHNNSSFILKQLMRFYLFTGNFNKAEEIYFECQSSGLNLNSTSYLPILLSRKEYNIAYEQYIKENFSKKLNHLLGAKYRVANSSSDISYEDNSILLAVYGPGDEIRFSSIYNEISLNFEEKHFSITCDERLYSLFKRSFPSINFIPVARTRGVNALYPVENYNQLPSIKLCTLLDNTSYKKLTKFDKIFLVTDFISKLRDKQEDFHGKFFLKEDIDLYTKFQNRLITYKNKLLVGINWRSSLTNFSRMEHYLSVQELSPIFQIPEIQFVNLQYDDCQSELNWLNENFPNKIINLEDIDQYNDFESVSALMKNLDLVIAPATSVAELAGALGIPTWLFSNSSEIDWRKVDSRGTDIWHNSITIVDVKEKGNKKLLVQEIFNKLNDFSKNYSKSDLKKIS